MGLTDFIRSQFIDIIEWTDDSRDTLSYRFPDEDKEIKRGAQLIVRESQIAQFVYLGQFGDTFGPGKHTLTTDNIPILTDLKGWKYGFESPFKADVYYVVTRLFTGNKWGTSNPVMMRDQDFGIVRLRAFGTYDFRVVDPQKFLKEVAGTDDHFRLDEFADTMRSRIVSVFSEALAEQQGAGARRRDALQRARRGAAAADQSGDHRRSTASRWPASSSRTCRCRRRSSGDRQALEHGGGRQPERLREVPDGAGAREGRQRRRRHRRGDGRRHGDGAADDESAGRHRWRRRRRPRGATAAAACRASRNCWRRPTPRKMLGVSEADVIASLEAGDLKGKRIGTQWRITQDRADRVPQVAPGVEPTCHPRRRRPTNGRDRAREVPLSGLRRRGELEPGEAGARLLRSAARCRRRRCRTRGADTVIVEHDLARRCAAFPTRRAAGRRAKISVRCQSCQAISVFDPDKVGQALRFLRLGRARAVRAGQGRRSVPSRCCRSRSPSRRRAI